MKKAVLISIKPQWVAKILNGEKTIEVRKTAPKCGLPIEVYIYCTKGHYIGYLPNRYVGKVVAKFTLNEVEELYLEPYIYDSRSVTYKSGVYKGEWKHIMERYSCLTESQMDEYLGNGSRFYAWHISDLEIFDEPKELDEFDYPCPSGTRYVGQRSINGLPSKKHPPRSWFYVEEKK